MSSYCRLNDLTSIQNTVEGLEKMQEYLKNRLSVAIESEKVLRETLNEENERSRELEELLRQEKEKNECFKELLQISDSENEIEHKDSNDAISAMSDPTHTFGTISTVLMQYNPKDSRYDEVSLQNRRLLRAFCNKSKELKEANQLVSELRDQQRKLHERIEELCCRYLNYKIKKHEEIFELRSCIEHYREVIEEFERRRPSGRTMDFSNDIKMARDGTNENLR